jgi:hypothetical protein
MADPENRRTMWSPAALDAAEEYAKNVSLEVAHLAVIYAARNGADVVTVSDVARAIQELQSRPGIYSAGRRSMRRRITQTYILISTLMVVFGLITAFYSTFDDLSSTTRVGLLLALSGVLIAASTSVLTWFSLRRNKESRRTDSLSTDTLAWDFIRNYQEFEFELRSLISEKSGESASRGSVGTLAPLAARLGVLGESDVQLLRSLSRLRSETVHGKQADRSQYLSGIEDIRRIMGRVQVESTKV